MHWRNLVLFVAAIVATAGGPAAAQQISNGPSWYRSKDMQEDPRLGAGMSVPSNPGMYAEKDPSLGLCKPGADWGRPDPQDAANFAATYNAQRAQQGMPPLNSDPALAAAAMWKSMHMARYDYLDHDDPAPPEARSVFQRGIDCGYGSYIGENLGEGQDNARELIDEWMGSPAHRHNMENPAYQDMGVGVASTRGGDKYWTLDFGSKQ